MKFKEILLIALILAVQPLMTRKQGNILMDEYESSLGELENQLYNAFPSIDKKILELHQKHESSEFNSLAEHLRKSCLKAINAFKKEVKLQSNQIYLNLEEFRRLEELANQATYTIDVFFEFANDPKILESFKQSLFKHNTQSVNLNSKYLKSKMLLGSSEKPRSPQTKEIRAQIEVCDELFHKYYKLTFANDLYKRDIEPYLKKKVKPTHCLNFKKRYFGNSEEKLAAATVLLKHKFKLLTTPFTDYEKKIIKDNPNYAKTSSLTFVHCVAKYYSAHGVTGEWALDHTSKYAYTKAIIEVLGQRGFSKEEIDLIVSKLSEWIPDLITLDTVESLFEITL